MKTDSKKSISIYTLLFIVSIILLLSAGLFAWGAHEAPTKSMLEALSGLITLCSTIGFLISIATFIAMIIKDKYKNKE